MGGGRKQEFEDGTESGSVSLGRERKCARSAGAEPPLCLKVMGREGGCMWGAAEVMLGRGGPCRARSQPHFCGWELTS